MVRRMKSAIALLFAVAVNLRTSLSATAAIIPNILNRRVHLVSIIDVEYSLDDMVKLKDKAMILFYASWCLFSQKFLPIFEKYAQGEK